MPEMLALARHVTFCMGDIEYQRTARSKGFGAAIVRARLQLSKRGFRLSHKRFANRPLMRRCSWSHLRPLKYVSPWPCPHELLSKKRSVSIPFNFSKAWLRTPIRTTRLVLIDSQLFVTAWSFCPSLGLRLALEVVLVVMKLELKRQ